MTEDYDHDPDEGAYEAEPESVREQRLPFKYPTFDGEEEEEHVSQQDSTAELKSLAASSLLQYRPSLP
jgi:hypothetical protein